jgi:succinoglycan biosynthesis protein ExoA
MANAADRPLVSIVMPVRNEAAYLDDSFRAIDAQTYPADRMEILVVDGGSTDATVETVRRRSESDPRTRLLGGAGVNTPRAMNVGIEASRGAYVAKVDGHGFVNPAFIALAAETLDGDPAVGCVGGIIEPMATTAVQRAIQVARFSRLGVGGGVYTARPVRQDVDTVQCGVYRRSVLDAIGGFDPDMQFGEDEEINHRVRAAGARIVLEPAMQFRYHVRPTLKALFRQYFNYGRARIKVVRKHPGFLRPKHLVPSIVVVALAVSVPLGLLSIWVPVIVIGGYVVALLIAGVVLAVRASSANAVVVAGALACLHLGYGLGMLRGLVDEGRAG